MRKCKGKSSRGTKIKNAVRFITQIAQKINFVILSLLDREGSPPSQQQGVHVLMVFSHFLIRRIILLFSLLVCISLSPSLPNIQAEAQSKNTKNSEKLNLNVSRYPPHISNSKSTKGCIPPPINQKLWGNQATGAHNAHKNCITGKGVRAIVIDIAISPSPNEDYGLIPREKRIDTRCAWYKDHFIFKEKTACIRYYQKETEEIKHNLRKPKSSDVFIKTNEFVNYNQHGTMVSEAMLATAPGIDLYLISFRHEGRNRFKENPLVFYKGLRASLTYCARLKCDLVNLSIGSPSVAIQTARQWCANINFHCDVKDEINKIESLIRSMIQTNVVFFVSVGNHADDADGRYGPPTSFHWPATMHDPHVLGIGATDKTNLLSVGTPRNTHMDFVCPGEALVIPKREPLSGSSFASPTCAGIYALYMEAHPQMRPKDIIARMKTCSIPAKIPPHIRQSYPQVNFSIGYRIPQAPKAPCPK